MTGMEIAAIIGASAAPLTAVLTYLNGRASKIRGQEQKAALLDAKVDIMKATDGVVTKLLNEKEKAGDAKAALSAIEGHQEGLANGRIEARAEVRAERLEERLDAIEKKE